MPRRWLVVLLVGLVAGLLLVPGSAHAATASQQAAAAPATSHHGVSSFDRHFMRAAAQAGLFEIRSSRLALARSHDRRVRAFARRMIRDHTRMAAMLAALAARKGVTLPKRPNAQQRAILRRLAGLHGRAFDRAYIAAQIRAHIQAIALFRLEVHFGSNRQVRELAAASLPTLRLHLRLARQVAAHLCDH